MVLSHQAKNVVISSKPEAHLECSQSSFRYGFMRALEGVRGELRLNDVFSILSTGWTICEVVLNTPPKTGEWRHWAFAIWVSMFVLSMFTLGCRLWKLWQLGRKIKVSDEDHMQRCLRDISDYDSQRILLDATEERVERVRRRKKKEKRQSIEKVGLRTVPTLSVEKLGGLEILDKES